MLNQNEVYKTTLDHLQRGTQMRKNDGAKSEWVIDFWREAEIETRKEISKAIFEALTTPNEAINFDALNVVEIIPEVLNEDQYIYLLDNSLDNFNNKKHPLDSANRNRGRDFLKIVWHQVKTKEKSETTKNKIRQLANNPIYADSAVAVLSNFD